MTLPQAGCYGCVPSKSTTGWIIEHGTASPYGHAFLVLPFGLVAEARPGGVGPASLERYVRMGAVFNSTEPLTNQFRQDVCQAAVAHYGARYDWAAIANLALRCLGRTSELLPVGRHGAYICSQFVTVLSTAAGKVYCPDEDRWTVSPRTLADRITTQAWA